MKLEPTESAIYSAVAEGPKRWKDLKRLVPADGPGVRSWVFRLNEKLKEIGQLVKVATAPGLGKVYRLFRKLG